MIGATAGNVKILPIKHSEPAIILSRNGISRLVTLHEESFKVLPYSISKTPISIQNGDQNMLMELDLKTDDVENPLEVRTIQIEGNTEETVKGEYFKTLAPPTPVVGLCRGSACRVVISTKDRAIALLQLPAGKILWTREEALSNVVGVEFIELPVSDLDASIEREFAAAPGDILGMFIKRVTSQTRQLTSLFTGQQAGSSQDLVRDEFGLHKLIILMTEVGKLYALDTSTGLIRWSKFFENITPFTMLSKPSTLFFEQRTARYSPLPAVCTLLARDVTTGNGVLYR